MHPNEAWNGDRACHYGSWGIGTACREELGKGLRGHNGMSRIIEPVLCHFVTLWHGCCKLQTGKSQGFGECCASESADWSGLVRWVIELCWWDFVN